MSEFRDFVDAVLRNPKTVAGALQWKPTDDRIGQFAFWGIDTERGLTPHRLYVRYYHAQPTDKFTVMFQIGWAETDHHPVVRLNIDHDSHKHTNRPPRPDDLPAVVRGNRFYSWSLNRERYTISPLSRNLLCRPLAHSLALADAIRMVATACFIDIGGVDLPTPPSRTRLLG